MKTDEQIRKVVTASIRRHARDIETWQHTRLWEAGEATRQDELLARCALSSGELPILYSHCDGKHWTFVTTRHIWSCDEGHLASLAVAEVTDSDFGNLKGHQGQQAERMSLTARDGRVLLCPYETGYASMGIVYAVRTLRQLRR